MVNTRMVIATVIYWAATQFVFFFLSAPFYWRTSPGIVVVESLLAVLSLGLYISVIARAPGPIPDRDRRAKEPAPPGVPWCHVCHVRTGRRVKHCRECNVCVVDRDHHCQLMGVCVGASNFRLYLPMLWAFACFQLWAFIAIAVGIIVEEWNFGGIVLILFGLYPACIYPTCLAIFLCYTFTVQFWRSPNESPWNRCKRKLLCPPGPEYYLHIRSIEEEEGSRDPAAAMEEGDLEEPEGEELVEVVIQGPGYASIHSGICSIEDEGSYDRDDAMGEGNLEEPYEAEELCEVVVHGPGDANIHIRSDEEGSQDQVDAMGERNLEEPYEAEELCEVVVQGPGVTSVV